MLESTLKEAQEYCEKLAKSHYENFIVASLFLPPNLKQHFYNVYAYCRISDDLADESPDPSTALKLLDEWLSQLNDCYAGKPHHPVFVALRETIDKFQIPIDPFRDLLTAFRQDQTKTRYNTYDELLEYCRYSANPVGHLVLYLFGYSDEKRQQLSNQTCTALQLANHWQDIERDLTRLDRIYLPLEDMDRFGYTEGDLRKSVCDQRFQSLMAFEIQRTRTLFEEGLQLSNMVERQLGFDIELFGRCGLAVLEQIEAANYDVFRKRPEISKFDRMKILTRCWWDRK
jgi:squalene synthase HpnC